MKRGAIAIGSNSTRLLVAEKKNGILTDIFRGREETRLFLGLDEQGRIALERLEDTAQAVARLYLAGKMQGAGEIALFATSATRDAKNGSDLAKRIEEICGLKLQVISGRRLHRIYLGTGRGNSLCPQRPDGGLPAAENVPHCLRGGCGPGHENSRGYFAPLCRCDGPIAQGPENGGPWGQLHGNWPCFPP